LIVEWAIIIAVALLVLVIGRWILQWVRRIIEKLLGADWLDGVWQRSGVNTALAPSGQTAASITATVVYAYLMVGLWLVVVRILNLDTIEVLLTRLLAWIPLLLLAAIIIIVAAAAASWTADLVRPFADNRHIPWLTWAIQVGIIVFGVLFALDILEVDFAEDVVKIVTAAFGIALAIAFGVGGIDAAKQWWAKYGTPGISQRDAASHQQPQSDQ
jgi:hypothetical protein